MATTRDYRAEYARRIARGLRRGLSRSRARGHPRPGEASASGRRITPDYDRSLEDGLRAIRRGDSLTRAARSIGAAPERLRRYIVGTGVVKKRDGRWWVSQDRREREVPIFSRGRLLTTKVRGFEEASRGGRYMAAVRQFLDSNDAAHLQQFAGDGVRDVRGKWHPFETDPNVLYRLTAAGPEPFEEIYRIVV